MQRTWDSRQICLGRCFRRPRVARRETADRTCRRSRGDHASGGRRAIFFHGRDAYSADGTEADGSAGWPFEANRNGDETVITFGPEQYVIPDALVFGG